jgi:DNA recombination-mediator protein A
MIFKEVRVDQMAELRIHPYSKLSTNTAGQSSNPCVISAPNPAFPKSASLTARGSKRLPPPQPRQSTHASHFSAASKALAQIQAVGCNLVAWDESNYPQRLREICDSPTLLYVCGNVKLLSRHTVSVAGSRRPTP